MVTARYSCKFNGAIMGAVSKSDTAIVDIYYLTQTFADVRFRFGSCDRSSPGSV